MEHFGEDKPCKLTTNTKAFNRKRVQEAGKAALSKYREDHPEVHNLELKYNPMGNGKGKKKKIRQAKSKRKRKRRR